MEDDMLSTTSVRTVLAETRALFTVHRGSFLWLCGLYCVGLFALLRSNVLYVNDTSRLLERGLFLTDVGRMLADALGSALFIPAADMSPLTQLAAAACMAAAGVLLCVTIYGRRMDRYQVLCCVPLGLSPYFLQNMSYKFDCVFMALSALCVTAGFHWLVRYGRSWAGQLLGGLALFCSLCLYQAMLNIFFILGAFWCLVCVLDGKGWRAILGDALHLIPALLCALLLYKGSLLFVTLNAYTQQHSGTLPLRELLPGMVRNLLSYAAYIRADWSGNRLGAVAAIMLMLCVLSQCVAAFRAAPAWRERWLRLAAAQGLWWLGALAMPGLMLLLQAMVLEPRVFAPTGCYLALSMLLIHRYARSVLRWVSAVACGLLLVYCFGFAAAYGNALAIQDDFERMLRSHIVMDMKVFCERYHTSRVFFAGFMPRSPQLHTLEEEFPAIAKMVQVSLRNGDWHTPRKLSAWGVPAERMLPREIADWKPRMLKQTPFYSIGISSENILFLTLPYGRQDGLGR